MRKAILSVLFLSTAIILGGGEQLAGSPVKKWIKFGFDDPTPKYLAENIGLIEQFMPADGTGINVHKAVKLPNGKIFHTEWNYFSGQKFDRAWFQEDIRFMKQVKAKRLKHNFLNTNFASFRREFDIFDDQFWATVCHNFGVMAYVAKEGGCAGLRFDLEDYGGQTLWRFDPARGKSYAEAWETARKRGQQWMGAIVKEFPDIKLFCFYWLDLAMGAARSGNPDIYGILQSSSVGLLVPFINGVYDMLPPNAQIIEGMEASGYAAYNEASYQRLRGNRDAFHRKLLAAENLRKFREQTSLAIATYTSSYYDNWREKSAYAFNKHLIGEKMDYPALFRRNFILSVKYSDEYVWTWSDNRKWYPMKYPQAHMDRLLAKGFGHPNYKNVPGPYMGMAIPGIEESIKFALDPYGYARQYLNSGKKLKNRLYNGGFETVSGKAKPATGLAPDSVVIKNIPNWETWQPKFSKGTFSLAPGKGIGGSNAVKLEAVNRGTIHQPVQVKKSAVYIVRACCKTEGRVNPALSVSWRDPNGKWCGQMAGFSGVFKEDIGSGWKRATVVVPSVIPQAGFLSVGLYSTARNLGDIVYFDNIEVFELFGEKPQAASHITDYLNRSGDMGK